MAASPEYQKNKPILDKIYHCLQAIVEKHVASSSRLLTALAIPKMIPKDREYLSLTAAIARSGEGEAKRQADEEEGTVQEEWEAKGKGESQAAKETEVKEENEGKEEAERQEHGDDSLRELGLLIAAIDLACFKGSPEDEKLLRKALALAIRCNQTKVVDRLLTQGLKDTAVEVTVEELQTDGFFEGCAEASVSILKKMLLLDFPWEGMPVKCRSACYSKAIKDADISCFLALYRRGIAFDQSDLSLVKDLLWTNLEMAKEIFQIKPLQLVPSENPLFLTALQENRLEVAHFISQEDVNFTDEMTQKAILKALKPYVEAGNRTIVKFCIEKCGVKTRDATHEDFFSFDYFKKYQLLQSDRNFLLAHAVLHGHKTLFSLLKIDEENACVNWHTYVELVLKSGEISQLRHLQKNTRVFFKLGAKINFSTSNEIWIGTIFNRCVAEILVKQLSPKKKKIILDYMLFLAENGADIVDSCIAENGVIEIMLKESEKKFPTSFLTQLARVSADIKIEGECFFERLYLTTLLDESDDPESEYNISNMKGIHIGWNFFKRFAIPTFYWRVL